MVMGKYIYDGAGDECDEISIAVITAAHARHARARAARELMLITSRNTIMV